jgi:hypothetical protein
MRTVGPLGVSSCVGDSILAVPVAGGAGGGKGAAGSSLGRGGCGGGRSPASRGVLLPLPPLVPFVVAPPPPPPAGFLGFMPCLAGCAMGEKRPGGAAHAYSDADVAPSGGARSAA